MERPRPIELIIFDLDGTLIDSKKDIANAVNFTLKSLALREKPLPEIFSYIGYGLRELLSKSLPPENKNLLAKALEVFEGYFMQHSLDQTVLYPYAQEILEYFREKPLAVVTNRGRKSSEAALRGLGIMKYFKAIAAGDDEGCLKPSPCPLEKVIKKLAVPKSQSMLVGDMAVDVAAGKAAGITTCAVTYGIGKKEEIAAARPDYMIDGLQELKNITG